MGLADSGGRGVGGRGAFGGLGASASRSPLPSNQARRKQEIRREQEVWPGFGLFSADPLFRDDPARAAHAAAVITTSGSTGHPKSVVLSREAIGASVSATAARIGEGRWLLALAPGYVAGLQVLARSIAAGTDPVVMPSVETGGRFEPGAFVEATAELGRGTDASASRYTSLVPAQLADLLDAGPDAVAALRTYAAVLIGGQAMPEPLRERAADAGVRVVRTYGSSETAGGCVYDGHPLDGVRLRIAGTGGSAGAAGGAAVLGPVGPPHTGEVLIGGATLADGYLGDPERSGAAFTTDADGARWYRTGDAGEVLPGGALRITGRLDNVIVSGGVNVSLDRVERAVRRVAGLERAVVVPVADERWGEASIIMIDTDASSTALADARAAVEAEVGRVARPRELVLVDRIPTLVSGKPDRVALRALAAER